jgi:aspartate beta-hydroxylase
MQWGEYLCRGAGGIISVSHDKWQGNSFEKLVRKLETALQHLGLSRFSASVAVQFIAGKLQSGEQHKMARALKYLLDLLNHKSSSVRAQESVHRCPQLVPGLTAQPFWDTSTLQWVVQLEASYDDIKREFIALREMPNQKLQSGFQHYRSPKQQLTKDSTETAHPGEEATDRGQWNVCYFHLHGMDFSDNLARCPLTATAIDAVPRQYHHALFSALAPDTHVKPHCGPTNKKLRCHLPLHVPKPLADAPDASSNDGGPPPTAWLRVGNEYRALQEGKCVVFDDSFEHEACNPSPSEPRAVLIVDVWHPDLSDEEVKFFDFINKAQVKAAQRLSEALHKSSEGAKAEQGSNSGQGGAEEAAREDFFHVIQAARAIGISEEDCSSIWAD